MKLTFVRHGSTDWNSERRFQGQSDVPLNAEGRAQAQALGALLRGERFDRAVSSDLRRAYDTAQAICGSGAVERDVRWREFAFGQWEGLTWDEIVAREPGLDVDATFWAKNYAPTGGERFDQVCERVARALDDVRGGAHENVLVVTHAGPLHAMLHVIFGQGRADAQGALGVRFSPASVTRIAIDAGEPRIVALNDVGHL